MSNGPYRKDIDGLRMLAILPVVLNHAGFPGFPGGFVGVDIFFVISGFLITGILTRELDEQNFSILSFYERRARRILPALFVVLAVCLVGGLWLLSPHRYEALGKSVIATLAFGSNIWFWHEAGDYFSPNVEFEPLLHTWSLAVEEQFYLVFPLLLWTIASLRRRFRIIVVTILTILSFVLSLWMTQAAPLANFYLVPSRAWELGAGSLLALGAFPMTRSRLLHEIAGWVGLILILGSIFAITSETPFPGLAALPSVAGATLIIYSGTGAQSAVGLLLSWRAFVWFGLISYSLYLWHWPILVAARTLIGSHIPLSVAVNCIALSVLFAWLSWRYIESPFRKASGPDTISGNRILQLSGAGILFVGLFAVLIVLRDGFMMQTPDSIANYRDAIRDDPVQIGCMGRSIESPCIIGATETAPSIALWGDSHAIVMLSGFDKWLREVNKSAVAYTKSACLPLLGVYRANRPPNEDCDGFNTAVMTNISATPSIRTVILVGRWALSVEGTRLKSEAGSHVVLTETGQRPAGISDNPHLVEQGLNHLMSALHAREIGVVLVSSVPEIGRHVPDLVLRYGSNVPGRLVPNRTDVDQRNERADLILNELAERYGASVLFPREQMCVDRCIIELEGSPLYRDDNHLSFVGARWLVPKMMRVVDP